ncbi:MAG: hypothetical protein O7E52_08010 [Candidatus Poribacteria bacterium]|nr:hypothetical protein [Candidatus Poribacteria bacterium]
MLSGEGDEAEDLLLSMLSNTNLLLEGALLAEPLVVKDGHTKVPERPGLGVELDMDAVERYRVG